MDDISTVLLVLLLGDPLGLESGEGRESGTTGPDGVVSVLGGDDLDESGLWAHGIKLFLKSIGETFIKGGSSGEDDVVVEVFSNIDIALLDGTESHGVHTLNLVTLLDQIWEEETLWSHESWAVDGNGLTVGKLVHLLEFGGLSGLNLIGGWVKRNVTEIFLNFSNDLSPSGLSTLLGDSIGLKELGHMVGDGSSGNVVLLDGMGDLETLIHWNGVSNTISGVANHTSCSTVGVEGKHGLDGDVKTLNLEGLEHELGHLFSVSLWILWGLGEHDLVFRWVHSELVAEAVLPDLLHLTPIGDNTGFDWVGELEDTSHLLGLITNVLALGFNSNHLLVRSWDTHNGWELD
jgi:hypothetical protein